PVTPAIVYLLTNSVVTLTDAQGLISLTAQAKTPLSWPDLFGVIANQNTGDPAKFDLAVVYNPPGGAPGVSSPPALEKLTGLSLNAADPSFVVTQVNAHSRFLKVPAAPPGPVPAGFPAAPAMLSSSGTTDLKDTGATTY